MSHEHEPEALARVAAIVCAIGSIGRIGPDEDFYKAGFSSIGALRLLLDLEDAFGVSVPDDRFIAARTPRALHDIVIGLQQGDL